MGGRARDTTKGGMKMGRRAITFFRLATTMSALPLTGCARADSGAAPDGRWFWIAALAALAGAAACFFADRLHRRARRAPAAPAERTRWRPSGAIRCPWRCSGPTTALDGTGCRAHRRRERGSPPRERLRRACGYVAGRSASMACPRADGRGGLSHHRDDEQEGWSAIRSRPELGGSRRPAALRS